MNETPFKCCPNCSTQWDTLDDCLSDPEILLAGYQVHFDDLEGGLFFFTHKREGCYTTLALPVTAFLSLTNQPLLSKPIKQCCGDNEFCVRQGAITPPGAECECAWVREILQKVQNWEKDNPSI